MPRIHIESRQPILPSGVLNASAGQRHRAAYSRSVAILDKHKLLANALAERHGTVQLAVESSGVHAYMASPIALEKDGSLELMKRHLAVNLDKYLGGIDWAACCMKTGTPYRVSELMRMLPLQRRGYFFKTSRPRIVQGQINADNLEDDGKGNLVPRGPGEIIPITQVPLDNPGLAYLQERGFTDIPRMWSMCRMSWCIKENPKSFWKPTKGGFRESPQNRLILFIDQFGVQRGWQGRIIEAKRATAWYYLHPYTNRWVLALKRPSKASEWQEAIEPLDIPWKPRKYIFPVGIARNKCLMGLDAAIAWNKGRDRKVAILVEGPLDMLRFGPPAMATMGKYYSSEQRDLVAQNFDVVVYVADNDQGGDIGRLQVFQQLGTSTTQLRFADLPAEFKDAAEMRQDQADEFLVRHIFNKGGI